MVGELSHTFLSNFSISLKRSSLKKSYMFRFSLRPSRWHIVGLLDRSFYNLHVSERYLITLFVRDGLALFLHRFYRLFRLYPLQLLCSQSLFNQNTSKWKRIYYHPNNYSLWKHTSYPYLCLWLTELSMWGIWILPLIFQSRHGNRTGFHLISPKKICRLRPWTASHIIALTHKSEKAKDNGLTKQKPNQAILDSAL